MKLRIRALNDYERGKDGPALVVTPGSRRLSRMSPRPAVLEYQVVESGAWWPAEFQLPRSEAPAEEMPGLPLYDSKSRCPKCGYCDATTEYTGSDTIRRECKRCGASRYELPLDKGPRKLQPGDWARVHSPGDEYHGGRCEVLAEELPEKRGEEPQFRVQFTPFPGQPVAVYYADELHAEPTPKENKHE